MEGYWDQQSHRSLLLSSPAGGALVCHPSQPVNKGATESLTAVYLGTPTVQP